MSNSIDAEIKLFGTTIKSNLFHQNINPSSSSSPPMVNIISRFQDPVSDLNEPPKATNKPDKILSCPRCQSSNTKFCYYNNYNVNQPRYFCRNCQRYWTAGGSMRSVPIGSGRRKNKTWSTSNHNYLHITSQEQHNNNNNNNTNTILSFGSTDSSDTKIANEKNLNYQGFLAPQVMLPNSSPWPFQWSPMSSNANFYPVNIYLETTSCLGKRTRDEIEGGCKENTAMITKFVSESIRPSGEVLSKLLKNTEKKQEFNLFNGFETKGTSNRRSLVTETTRNLQANPAAMSRSMNFRESIQH